MLRRRPTLSAGDRDGLRTALGSLATSGRAVPARPLAVARGGSVLAVALPTHLAYGAGDAWTIVPWHEVDLGRWNAETSILEVDQRGPLQPLEDAAGHLVERSGRRHRIPLEHPERVAQVMAERVAATILFHRALPMPGRSTSLTVVARRNLVDQEITWLASPGRGMHTDDPEVRAYAAAAVRRLRAEFA